MIHTHRYILSLLCLLCFSSVDGQELLTLERAKEITLANNFGVQIARNNVSIAENQTAKRFNNYLPNIAANGGVNGDIGSATQKFNNGQEVNVSNAFTWGLNGSVGVNYTLFDQTRGVTFQQLKESLTATNLQLRQTIEQNLLQVYSSYYVVSQLADNIEALEDAISISKERLKRAEFQFDLGQSDQLNVLNAKVDIQLDSVNLLNAIVQLDTEKRNLNVAMGRAADMPFEIEKNDVLEQFLSLQEILDRARKENSGLQLNRQNLIVSELGVNLIDAESKPTLTSGISYDRAFTDNATGSFIEQSSSSRFVGNIGINWTIFDGTRSIRRQNAVINLSNQQLQINQLEQQVERDILNTWQAYQNDLFLIRTQQLAVTTNEENFKRTEEQLRSGQLSSIEFRQAQLNLLNAQISLSNAIYSAKLREVQLKQLMGGIME